MEFDDKILYNKSVSTSNILVLSANVHNGHIE